MKQLLLIICLSPFLAFTSPGEGEVNIGSITKAIENGDANALGAYFDSNVELAILDDEDIYDKAEAIKVLGQFFNEHKPKAFSQVHKGVSKNSDSQYAIGNLVSGSKTFRVYVYMKKAAGQNMIQEMRIDME